MVCAIVVAPAEIMCKDLRTLLADDFHLITLRGRLRFLCEQDMKAKFGDNLPGAGGLSLGSLKIGSGGKKDNKSGESDAASPRTPQQVINYELRSHHGIPNTFGRSWNTLSCMGSQRSFFQVEFQSCSQFHLTHCTERSCSPALARYVLRTTRTTLNPAFRVRIRRFSSFFRQFQVCGRRHACCRPTDVDHRLLAIFGQASPHGQHEIRAACARRCLVTELWIIRRYKRQHDETCGHRICTGGSVQE